MTDIARRLEELRVELRAERISYGELAELQALAEHIAPGDMELLEAAGVPEHGGEKMWVVRIPINVTADTREQAIEFALDDLRDPTMEWDTFEVQQTSGPHPKVLTGLCPVCGHYGDDCEGFNQRRKGDRTCR